MMGAGKSCLHHPLTLMRGIGWAAAMFCLAFATAPAEAQNWNEGPKSDEYEKFITQMKVGGDGPLDIQFWYQAGMIAGLQAAKEDYARLGTAPLYCLPVDLQPVDLRDAILAELKANPGAWRNPDVGVEKTAVHVARRKYPC